MQSYPATVSSAITGAGSLIKQGSGTLTLSGGSFSVTIAVDSSASQQFFLLQLQ